MKGVELKTGDLIIEDPVPDTITGYTKHGVRLFKLSVKLDDCTRRSFSYCPSGCRRYRCDGLPINPGVCARCQGKTDATLS